MLKPNVRLLVAGSGALLLCLSSVVFGQAPEQGGEGFASQGSGYLIGPGDTLAISVWREPELSATVPVRPDGRITTPLVEDIAAVGKTPTQLANEIEERLSVYIRSPTVSVIVQDFVGIMAEQIRVIGQAVDARSVPYVDGMTVLDVLIEVGGLTEFAAGNRSRIIRNTDGERREIRVRLDDLINKGQIEENVAVRPGDVLSIPESRF